MHHRSRVNRNYLTSTQRWCFSQQSEWEATWRVPALGLTTAKTASLLDTWGYNKIYMYMYLYVYLLRLAVKGLQPQGEIGYARYTR